MGAAGVVRLTGALSASTCDLTRAALCKRYPCALCTDSCKSRSRPIAGTECEIEKERDREGVKMQ